MIRLLPVVLLLSCSEASLAPLEPGPTWPPDTSLTVSGELCATAPDALTYPLRVLFVVDASESMRISDPVDPITGTTARERAVEEAAATLLDGRRDVAVGVVRFSAAPQPLTETVDPVTGQSLGIFTTDLGLIRDRLPMLTLTDRTTNLLSALSDAWSQVRAEIDRTPVADLPRLAFEVVVVTDGLPDAEGDGPAELAAAVDDLVGLADAYRLDRVAVSMAQLETGNVPVDLAAADLLGSLAERGGGTFRGFASGGDLDVLWVGATRLVRSYTVADLVAWNLQTMPGPAGFVTDSDADGLSDADEAAAGTHPLVPDTDGDGCRDGVEARLGQARLDPLDPTDCRCLQAGACTDADDDGVCDPFSYRDSDGDGLTDCEERWLGTSPRSADTDGDRLLDLHEARAGTRPDVDDRTDDADWDTTTDGDEVRFGTDPRAPDPAAARVHYDLARTGWRDGRACHGFTVTSIPLTALPAGVGPHTPPSPGWPGGQGFTSFNRVLLLAAEVPLDDQDGPARHRVACVEAAVQPERNLRFPPSGRMAVVDTDFVELTAFDPAEHCVRPWSDR